MISMITCTKNPIAQVTHEKNMCKTVGTKFEYILIDASKGDFGIAAGYNYGVSKAHGDILVFMHDDIFSMKFNWGQVLEQKFQNDPYLGAVGIAGTQYLFKDKYSWTAAGRPFIKGRIVHHLENGDFFASVYSPENGDFEVVACDGLFFAVRASLFNNIWFDEKTFTRKSFYDLDLCMQIRATHRIITTSDIVIKHRSPGTFDKEWHSFGKSFLDKYTDLLPTSCVSNEPDPNNYAGIQCIDLKGKAPMETIV